MTRWEVPVGSRPIRRGPSSENTAESARPANHLLSDSVNCYHKALSAD